jgi:hypothetical protein
MLSECCIATYSTHISIPYFMVSVDGNNNLIEKLFREGKENSH